MKIEMLTTKCGPNPSENWVEGQKRNVCDDEGNYWIKQGVAKSLETSVIKPSEKAVVTSSEKAVIKPPEVANVTPTFNTVQKSAKAATWGTQEVKK